MRAQKELISSTAFEPDASVKCDSFFNELKPKVDDVN